MISAALLAIAVLAQSDLPVVTVDRDNVVIDRSCRVVVPEGAIIPDADGNGVIQIRASGITVEFDEEHRELIAAPRGTPWETLTGIGIVIDGRSDVTIRGAHCHRFKVGILAKNADGLTLEQCDVAGGFAHRLASTPDAEDSRDWLWPHENDQHEWREKYGAGICIERSKGVTVRECFARRRQNGLILDRVTDSEIYDNDFSFLSGWGIAMWRSSANRIHHNALDFCIRGYSHGVYNRGQDSAGILMFEQCNENWIVANSATHGGDGVFAFAGKEALDTADRVGNNRNTFQDNDLSYAAAHGLELTFSFDNLIQANRFVENAICGIWGGYSQNTFIAHCTFEGNGDAGYGLERGGVNIEHGLENSIVGNEFTRNACGVHLWEDEDRDLLQTPWAKHNHKGSDKNVVAGNRFEQDRVALHLRNAGTVYVDANVVEDVETELRESGATQVEQAALPSRRAFAEPEIATARTTPVGERTALAGRENIIMGEYFPWDHERPMARQASSGAGETTYEVFGVDALNADVVEGDGLSVSTSGSGEGPRVVSISTEARGVHPYRVRLTGPDFHEEVAGTIINAKWSVRAFSWRKDPREDYSDWLAEANGITPVVVDEIDFLFGSEGPHSLGLVPRGSRMPDVDRFGIIAETTLRLPAGKWRFRTLSDDGVRVSVDRRRVIDNWTWHAPTTDEGLVEIEEVRDVPIRVEHFEIDGYSVLNLDIEPRE